MWQSDEREDILNPLKRQPTMRINFIANVNITTFMNWDASPNHTIRWSNRRIVKCASIKNYNFFVDLVCRYKIGQYRLRNGSLSQKRLLFFSFFLARQLQ